jgi:CheY-like chemotaxis protein/signal transduction histidine kinase
MLDSEGNFRHICCFLRDVTKRHMNDRLLEIQRKSTQSLLDLKDAFLKRIFHEMKTPLHTLFSHLKQFSTDLDPVSLVHLPNDHKVYQVELVSARLAKIPPDVPNREAPLIDAGQKNQQIRRICHVLENISSAQRYQEDHIFQVRPIFLHFPAIIQSLLCQAKETELKPGHHIQFRMEIDEITIRTDKMIQSVFYNLLANAIRYSPTDNRPHSILLKVTSTPATPTSVSSSSSAPSPAFVLHHFTLTNTFSPPIDLMEISQRFHTPSHSLNTDGATETIGLGLYVSSQIVQNLGGMLECHCHGSEIIVQFALSCQDVSSGDGQSDHLETVCPGLEEAVTWIPITPTLCEDLNPRNPSQLQQQPLAIHTTAPPAATAQVSQPFHRGSKRPRLSPEPAGAGAGVAPREGHVDTLWNEVRPHTHLLLIVEDSTLCQKIVLKLLTSFGFRCDIANNGYEALEKLKSPPCTVDVVLMDLRMPVMDGITAIKEIRKYPHLQGIPIIVTTAEVGPDIEKEVYHAGGDHFLTKPLKRMELLSALQKYIPLATLSATLQLGT